MISDKAKQIRERLLDFCSLMTLSYRSIEFDIDPFDPTHFHVSCGEVEKDFGSIDEVMQAEIIDGKCLDDIADEVIILDW